MNDDGQFQAASVGGVVVTAGGKILVTIQAGETGETHDGQPRCVSAAARSRPGSEPIAGTLRDLGIQR